MADPLRVVMICGPAPADPAHLARAAESVDLTVYHADHLPIPEHRLGGRRLSRRSLRPVLRSRRGHLWYWFRGLEAGLAEDRPDVIHVVSEPWGLMAVQAARYARRTGARLVLHGCDTLWHHGTWIERQLRRTLLRHTLPVTAAWAAENDKALAVARASGLPDRALLRRIHTNPRDARLFAVPDLETRRRARERLGVEDDEAVVVMIGRLVPAKGVEQFVRAAEELITSGVRARFFVAGDGPERTRLGSIDDQRILFLGPVRYPEGILDLLHGTDVLTCPSLSTPSWEDQGPRVVLEAMMCGVVPAVTPTGALPPMVGQHGVVADDVSAGAVARAIEFAIRKARGDGYRATISRWATGTYATDAVAEQLLEVWSALCDIDSGPRRNTKHTAEGPTHGGVTGKTILHYYPRAFRGDGGVTNAVWLWHEAFLRCGVDSVVMFDPALGTRNGRAADATRPVSHRGVSRLRLPVGLSAGLSADQVVVLHSGYILANLVAAAQLSRRGIPYVVVPHGAYDSHVRRRRRLVRAAWEPLERTMLARALGVHVFTDREADQVKRLAPGASPFVAPTGCTPPDVQWSDPAGGYLTWFGRYDVFHKGIDRLLDALSALPPDARPRIALRGRDSAQTREEVEEMVRARDLDAVVTVGPPVNGREKEALLLSSRGYIHPSRWECLGIALLEALAMGVPTLTTDGVNIAPTLRRAKAAVVTEDSVDGLAAALASWSEIDHQATSLRARTLVLQEFSVERSVEQWREGLARVDARPS